MILNKNNNKILIILKGNKKKILKYNSYVVYQIITITIQPIYKFKIVGIISLLNRQHLNLILIKINNKIIFMKFMIILYL